MRSGKPVSPQEHKPDFTDAAAQSQFDPALPGQQLLDAQPIAGRDANIPAPPPPPGMPRPLRAPKAPTAAEKERHALTHLPYASWCPYCVAGKRPNAPHRRVTSPPDVPMLPGDSGSFGDDGTGSGNQLTCLAISTALVCVYWACVVDSKGPTPAMVRSLSQFIIGCWLVRFG